jgi:uncharacterized membrane protein
MNDDPITKARPDQTFAAQLPNAVAGWRDRGIITPEQASAILASYETIDEGPVSRGRLISVLVILGAVLIGLGVILFIAANWQAISREMKLAFMLAGVPAVYAAGYWARYRRGYLRAGVAVILLASVFYGAAIHLVAQAYHIPVNSPDLVSLWFFGVVPLAYVTRSRAVLTLSIILFLAAIGFRSQVWLSDWDLTPFRAFPLYLVLGLALFSLGQLHGTAPITRIYAKPYELLGTVLTLASIYLLTFRFWWDEFYHIWGSGPSGPPGPGVSVEYWLLAGGAVLVMALGLLGGWLAIRRRGFASGLYPCLAAWAAVCLLSACLVVFLPAGDGWVYPLLFNALLLAGIVGLLIYGYVTGQEAFINIGLVFFSIDVFTRYFEFGFGLLDRSVVFIVAGVILLGGGFLLERGRRLMVGRLRTMEGSQ